LLDVFQQRYGERERVREGGERESEGEGERAERKEKRL
jgi:hypothetical protein